MRALSPTSIFGGNLIGLKPAISYEIKHLSLGKCKLEVKQMK